MRYATSQFSRNFACSASSSGPVSGKNLTTNHEFKYENNDKLTEQSTPAVIIKITHSSDVDDLVLAMFLAEDISVFGTRSTMTGQQKN